MIKLSLKKKSSIRQEFLNSKLGMRESMGGDFFQGGGGGLALILSLSDMARLTGLAQYLNSP